MKNTYRCIFYATIVSIHQTQCLLFLIGCISYLLNQKCSNLVKINIPIGGYLFPGITGIGGISGLVFQRFHQAAKEYDDQDNSCSGQHGSLPAKSFDQPGR